MLRNSPHRSTALDTGRANPPRTRVPAVSPAADEGGFTLVELIITMTIGVIVILAVLLLLDGSAGHAQAISGRVAATDDADLATARIGNDVRQTYAVSPWPTTTTAVATNTLDLKVATRAEDGTLTLHTIRWDCAPATGATSRTCTRRDLTAGTASQVGLGAFTSAAGPIFSVVAPATTGIGLPSVQVRLAAPIDGRRGTVDFSSTFATRNCQVVPLTAGTDCPWP